MRSRKLLLAPGTVLCIPARSNNPCVLLVLEQSPGHTTTLCSTLASGDADYCANKQLWWSTTVLLDEGEVLT